MIGLFALMAAVGTVWAAFASQTAADAALGELSDTRRISEAEFDARRPIVSITGPTVEFTEIAGGTFWFVYVATNEGARPLVNFNLQSKIVLPNMSGRVESDPDFDPNWIFPGQELRNQFGFTPGNTTVPVVLLYAYATYQDALTNRSYDQQFFFKWGGGNPSNYDRVVVHANTTDAKQAETYLRARGAWP